MKKHTLLFLFVVIIAFVMLGGCGPSPTPILTPETPTPTLVLPTLTASPTQVPTVSTSTGKSVLVAFVKDGNIQMWDEATGQSESIFRAGDAIAVTMSDDGQVLAFLRRSEVKRSELDWYEQSALWTVERNGENPRELISAEELRELLNASETDSTNIPQMEWIPGTHCLLYSGWKYFVQAEGESHATPQGLFLVDTETGLKSILVPAETSIRFVPSPDGQQIALLSTTDLGLINVDGTDLQQEVLRYPAVGVPGRIIPSGVWTQDASAFLIAAPIESDSQFVLNFTIWRVPVDGSPAQPLATITDSHSDSVTFSPDGRYAAFFRADSPGMVTHSGWFVTPLNPETGPLAVPGSSYLFLKNLHWSPAGVPYAVHEGILVQLCPDAAQDTEVCGEGINLGDKLAEIHWIDGTRFLFVTREPYDLYYGELDGSKVRIAEGVERFAVVAINCRNDSEFTEGGEGPADMSVGSDTLFAMTWRLRNTGTCAWDASYRLAFIAGERLSGSHSLPVGETIPSGGEIELSVNLISPAETGTYQGEWQLFDLDGKPFGVKLPLKIVVPSFKVMDLPPDLTLAQIPAGGHRMTFGEEAIWVIGENNTVSRIDLDTNQVVTTISVGAFPQDLAVGYGSVWVAASGLARIDPLTNTVSATIPIGTASGLNGVTTGAGSVWASSGEEGVVYRIDPNTNQVIAMIRVEQYASQITVTQDVVWVTNPIHPVLTRIDPNTNGISAEIILDCTTRRLVVDPTAVWVPCESTPTLFRIDPVTNQVVAMIAISDRSRGVAINSKAIWVTSALKNTLTQVDPETNQVIMTYRVDQTPIDIVAVQDELFLLSQDSTWRIRP